MPYSVLALRMHQNSNTNLLGREHMQSLRGDSSSQTLQATTDNNHNNQTVVGLYVVMHHKQLSGITPVSSLSSGPRCHIFIYKCTFTALYYGNKITFICQSGATCGPIKCHKCVCGRGSAPDPAGRAYDAPSDPLVGWGGDTPSPDSTPLGAVGASMFAPSTLVCVVTNSA